MVRQTRIVFVWLALIFLLRAAECAVGKDVPAGDGERERNQRRRYTASWAVEITEGGDKAADKVAQRHGYRNLGKVSVETRIFGCRRIVSIEYNNMVYVYSCSSASGFRIVF